MSSVGATVLLARTAGVDMQSLSFALGAEWRRIALSGSFGGAEEAVTFGIEVAPGESVDLREIQAEAQAGMSGYKKTFLPCSVYSQARFRDEALEFTAEAPPTMIRCEHYLAGSFRRGSEAWPVLSLRTLVESPAFLHGSS